jgi:5-methylcytosine-specific restriction enzyme A
MAKLTTLKPRIATLGGRLPTIRGTSWRSTKQSASARGYDRKWQKESKAFLAEHPLCQCPDCDDGRKRSTAATVVDHRIPHRGDMTLFWDRSNWQAMAKPCHDRKTQQEQA